MRFFRVFVLFTATALVGTTCALDKIQSATADKRRDPRRSLHFAWENERTVDERLSFAEFCQEHLTECKTQARNFNPLNMVLNLVDDSGKLADAVSNLINSIANDDLELNDIVALVVIVFTEIEWGSILGALTGQVDADVVEEEDTDPLELVQGVLGLVQTLINEGSGADDGDYVGALVESSLAVVFQDNAQFVADSYNMNMTAVVTEDNIGSVIVDLILANIDVVEQGLISTLEFMLDQTGISDSVSTVVVAVLRIFMDLMEGVLPNLTSPEGDNQRMLSEQQQPDINAGKPGQHLTASIVSKGTVSRNNSKRRRNLKKQNDISKSEKSKKALQSAEEDSVEDYAMAEVDGEESFVQEDRLFGAVPSELLNVMVSSEPTVAPIQETTSTEDENSDRNGRLGIFGIFQRQDPTALPVAAPTEQPVAAPTKQPVAAPTEQPVAELVVPATTQPVPPTVSPVTQTIEPAVAGGQEIPDQGGIFDTGDGPQKETNPSNPFGPTIDRLNSILETISSPEPILIAHGDHFHEISPLDESVTLLRVEYTAFFDRLRVAVNDERQRGIFDRAVETGGDEENILNQFTNFLSFDLIMTVFNGIVNLIQGISNGGGSDADGPFTYLSSFINLAAEVLDQVAPDSPIGDILSGLLQVVSSLSLFQGVFTFLEETFPAVFDRLIGPRLQTAVRVIDTEIGEILGGVQRLTELTEAADIVETSDEIECRLELLSCESSMALAA